MCVKELMLHQLKMLSADLFLVLFPREPSKNTVINVTKTNIC